MASHRAAADTTWITTVLVIAAAATLALLPSANGEDMTCSPDGEVCVSPTTNQQLFLEDEFRRVCQYDGPENPGAELEWLRDGEPVDFPQTNLNQLIIDSIDSGDAGTYSCRATLANGTVIGPIPAGTLTVLGDPSQISVPPSSYFLNGTNHSLTCETTLEYTQIFWKNESSSNHTTGPLLTLTSVNITTEGEYTCEVLIDSKTISEATVAVHVLVPHIILSTPPTYQLITGSLQGTFTVEFQGRAEQNTTVTWLKDGVPLSQENSQRRIETVFQSEQLRGTSSLVFDPISRRDMGVYQMVLDSSLGADVFPDAERRAETSFQLDVVVPPSLPTNLSPTTINRTTAMVTWVLTNRTADAGADTLTLAVRYSNMMEEYVLPGGETRVLIPVVPGTEYEFTLTAQNQDGSVTTQPTPYQTSPGAPSISDVFIVRMNETSFNLIMAVEYTGGGDITYFDVSYRYDSNMAFDDSLELIPATASPNSMLEWNGIVIIPRLQDIDGQLHFRVSAVNSHGLRAMTEAPENLVPPGAPLQPSLTSSTTSSLTVSVQLSQEGSAPILKLTALITNSALQFSTIYNISGPYNPGDTISFTAEDLSSDAPFVVVTYATNIAGNGLTSQETTFTTDALDENESLPLPLWAIVAIGGGTVILVIVLITCAIICYRCRRQPRKQNYSVNKRPQKPISSFSAGMHHLDSSNPLVSRRDKPLITLTNGGITVSTFIDPKPQDKKRHTRNTDDLGQRNTSTTSFEDSPPTTKSRLERGSSTILPQRSSRAVSSTTLESSTPASVKREPEVSDDNGNEIDSGVEVERSNPALPQSASSTLPRSTSIPRGITPDPAFQRELEHRVQTHSSSALLQETSIQRSASVVIPGANSSSSYKPSDHRLKSQSSNTLPLTGDLYRTSSAAVTHAGNTPPSHFNQRFQNEITSTSSCNASASEVTDSSMDLDYPHYMPSLHDSHYHGESIHSLPTLRSGVASVHSTQESSAQYPMHMYSSQYVSDV